MATNFPTSLDSLTNPTASDKLNSVSVPHATQHSNINDAVEALEAKVGVDGSAVTSSHDYILSNGVLPTLNVDSGVLVVDDTNNRVGVNDATPSYDLDVTGDINATGDLRIGGTAIGELTDYSSSISFFGFTLGNGTVVASYARVNDLVAYSGRVVLGSTSSMTGPLDITLPVTAATLTNAQAGVAYCDNPFRRVAACGVFGNVNNMRIFAENYSATYSAVTDVSSTVPFTWASTHSFGWNLIYLAA